MSQKALPELAPEAPDPLTHVESPRECPELSILEPLPAAISFKVWLGGRGVQTKGLKPMLNFSWSLKVYKC